jgi:UDP:flavonoid glycosyltransferase YjiC (YdhE family)
MRVLFCTTAGSGHYAPMVPFAETLRDAGHEVRVAAPTSFVSVVQSSGHDAVAVGERRDDDAGAMFGRMQAAGFEGANAILLAEGYGRLFPEAALPALDAFVANWHPDLIARETAEFASVLVALKYSIPMVEVSNVLLSMRPMFAEGVMPNVAALAAHYELPAPSALAVTETPVVTLAPATIDPPPDGAHRYRVEPGEVARPSRVAGDPPLVYVTFGSEAARVGFFPSVYRAAIDQLTGHGWRVLITIGGDADRSALGAVPDDVQVESWVDQRAVLEACDAVVFHGGFGTLIDVLASGTPAVVVPLFSADQFVNASRLAEVGSAVAVAGPGGLEELATAVDQALTDGPISAVATGLQREWESLQPAAASLDFLTSLRS